MARRRISYPAVPHFALPFRFESGADGVHSVVTEQDTFEEIRDCVSAIVRYTRGERPEAPNFGITPPEFEVGVDTNAILKQAEENEPRVRMIISSEISSSDIGIEQVVLGVIAEIQDLGGGTNV